ncbi:outer membrane protein [Niabella sp. 22666]|uniref:outer membrane protein n=1 Tax=Niabella sp. 22666 TaxID=3453954 RepID=UPI003F87BB76
MRKYLSLLLCSIIVTKLSAQEYIGQKSYAGVTLGTLSYTGIYSKGASLISHTSMSASVFYGHKLVLPKQLFIRGELMLGEVAGDNTEGGETITDPLKGAFRGYVVEGSAKVEYEILDLYRHKFTPYVNGGVGAYYLFDYEPQQGDPKTTSDSWGIVAPVGGGIKYMLNKRIKIFAEGSYRFFPKNLDNFPDKTVDNPNHYYSIAVGASFSLQKFNRLW